LKTFEGLIKIRTPDLIRLGVPQIYKFASIDLPILKKSVPNLNHYSRSYIQKTQKENHEIKIPEDRKLKKTTKFHEQMKPEF